MLTIHVEGTMINSNFQNSFYDVKSFDFDGQDDYAIDQAVKSCFFDMKAKGFVNVALITEDSLVPEDCAMPELRYGKPYMLGNGGYPTDYVADMSFEEIAACW